MKKYLITGVLSLVLSQSAIAAPRWLTAAPRAVGRTVKTMAMPWTDKQQAVRDYIIVGAVFADGYTSHLATMHPNNIERSPFLPNHPSGSYYWSTMGPLAIFEATFDTYEHEVIKDDSNWAWRNLTPAIVAGSFVLPHTLNTVSNVKAIK